MKHITKKFKDTLLKTKLRMVRMHYEAKAGHLGSNLSCIDILMILHHFQITENDYFVLSKGHSAGALYSTLWSLGSISDSILKSFSKDGTTLPGHPSGASIPGLLFSTGSLGHGPSLSSGLALSKKIKNESGYIYCLCSDGEMQEGSCWESIIFSVHNQLHNMVLLIDQNGLQGFGSTEEVVSYSDLSSRLKSFNTHVQTVNGHNLKEILLSLNNLRKDRLNIVVFNTVKGKFLHNEGKVESHYLPLTKNQYKFACSNINKNILE
jgi:transketolase